MGSLVARAMQNSERLGLYVWVHEVSYRIARQMLCTVRASLSKLRA